MRGAWLSVMLLATACATAPRRGPTMNLRVQLVTQIGHSRLCGGVDATFLGDPTYAVTVDAFGDRVLWHTPTGRVLRRELGQQERVSAPVIVMAPSGDAFARIDLDGRVELTQTASSALGDAAFLAAPTPNARATAIAFTPNGRRLLTAWSDAPNVVVWDVAERRVVSELPLPGVRVLAVSANGALAAAASATKAWVWRTKSSRVEATIAFEALESIEGIAVAADPPLLVLSSGDRVVAWDHSEQGLLRYVAEVEDAGPPRISPNGLRIAVPSLDGVALLDSEDGARVWSARDATLTADERSDVEVVRFASNGRTMITGHQDCTASVWSVERAGPPVRLTGRAAAITAVANSPGLPVRMVVGTERGTVRVSTIEGISNTTRLSSSPVEQVAFSTNGARVVARSRDEVGVWDVTTWTRRFTSTWSATSARLSNDGALVALGRGDRLEVWAIEGEERVADWTSDDGPIAALPFFDGDRIVVLLESGAVKALRFGESGLVAGDALDSSEPVTDLRFDDDGDIRLVVGAPDAPMSLFEARSGVTKKFGTSEARRSNFALSGSGQSIAAVSEEEDGRVRLLRWTTTSSAPVQVVAELDPRRLRVESLAFTFDEQYLVGGLSDGTLRLWDVTPREPLRLVGFDDGTWAVVLGNGYFDATNGGDVQGLQWVLATRRGPVPIALEQLKRHFYTPHLLVRYHARETFSEGEVLAGIESQPRVEIIELPEPDDPRIEIAVENDEGGIGPTTVKLNGREVVVRRPPEDFDGDRWTVEVDLSKAPTLLVGPGTRPNVVEVFAMNRAESIASPPAVVSFGRPGGVSRGVVITPTAELADDRPRLFAVVVGASDYADDRLDLGFAAIDAASFARALELGAEKYFSAAEVQLLVSDKGSTGTPATEEAIFAALEKVRQRARPEDVFVLFLAGHGAIARDEYFFVTAEAKGIPTDGVPTRAAISTAELLERIKSIAALQQALILDTCHAGGSATEFALSLAPIQVKALQELKDRLSIYVLAGSTTQGLSFETPRLGHGVLTYALLHGMTGAAIPLGAPWNVDQLFLHALQTVPVLSRQLTGVQRPEVARPLVTSSFDIGRNTPELTQKLDLLQPFPVLVRTTFLDAAAGVDRLDLMKRVDDALRERPVEVTFVDRHTFPKAYAIVGRYAEVERRLELQLSLYVRDGSQWSVVTSTNLTSAIADAPRVIVDWAVSEATKHRSAAP